jgi:hypothetical protein
MRVMNLSHNKSELYTKEDEADKRVCADSADLVSNHHIRKPYSLFTPFLHHDTEF